MMTNDQALVTTIENLAKMGISPIMIQEIFVSQKNKFVDLQSLVKISSSEEGGYLEFKTLDDVSIIVPANMSAGNHNKFE